MTGASTEASANLFARLNIYQRERFPLGRTAALVLVFSAASASVSAHLAGRAPPGLLAYAAAFVVTLSLFFQLRVLDEIKDGEDDRRYRPERPIPRGLVTLPTIIGLGAATIPLAIAAAGLIDLRLLFVLAGVWTWMALMAVEFFVPQWLKARPFAYMVSHMAIMPAIDLLVTGFEWVPHGAAPAGLILFLLLSFVNGCILEIGRKLWAPASEREGVETYSALLGPSGAGLLWMGCVVAALGLLVAVGLATGTPMVTGLTGVVAALWVLAKGVAYRRDPSVAHQQAIDTAAGLWVFACYAAAGFAPFAKLVAL